MRANRIVTVYSCALKCSWFYFLIKIYINKYNSYAKAVILSNFKKSRLKILRITSLWDIKFKMILMKRQYVVF